MQRRLDETTLGESPTVELRWEALLCDGQIVRMAQIKALYAAAPLQLAEHPVLRRIVDTGEALLVPRLDLAVYASMMSPEYVEHYKTVGAHSVLFVAVRTERRSIGLLALRRYSPDAPPFDEGDQHLAQTLADHAGLAITNARLLRSARQHLAARTRVEARFARLSSAGIIGIVVGNLSARIVEINDMMLTMLGFSRDEILSGAVSWKELTPPEWKRVDARAIEELGTLGCARKSSSARTGVASRCSSARRCWRKTAARPSPSCSI